MWLHLLSHIEEVSQATYDLQAVFYHGEVCLPTSEHAYRSTGYKTEPYKYYANHAWIYHPTFK